MKKEWIIAIGILLFIFLGFMFFNNMTGNVITGSAVKGEVVENEVFKMNEDIGLEELREIDKGGEDGS